MTNLHIKKGDSVVILSGDDKGKKGKVTQSFPAIGKIVVEGLNVVKKHVKPRKEGQKGQTIEVAMPMHASKVKKAE